MNVTVSLHETINNIISNVSIDVNWRPIPMEHRRGILIGYRISAQAVNGTDKTAIMKECPNVNSFKNLSVPQRFTLYNITVRGYNIKGNGPTAWVSFLTPEDGNTFFTCIREGLVYF